MSNIQFDFIDETASAALFEAELLRNIPENSSLLVAFSAGRDSTLLAELCHRLQSRAGWKLAIAHVDHGLRPDSSEDLAFAREFAQKRSLRFHSRELSPPDRKENLEAWGRKQRYAFFAELIEAECYDYVVTAHSASDCVETFLIRLFQGRELRGIQQEDLKRRLLRPFLSVSRKGICKVAAELDLEHREDPTNSSEQFFRNRVRNELMPKLEEFQSGCEALLYKRARETAVDIAEVESLCAPDAALEWGTREWADSLRGQLQALPSGMHWRVMDQALKIKLGFNPGRGPASAALDVLVGDAVATDLPGGFNFRRSKGEFALRRYRD